ncbi:MAG: HAMP domain-containing sensor histidine kinase [Candidatus Nealsonbacteria bacterium]|nr:HAMP domain-containing sensor histidine kinase [Candidatus Nealsonbacteria bacterium]
MNLKNIFEQLNLPAQCRKYGLALWECPQFLFLIMGLVIMLSILASYAIGIKYVDDPYMVALMVIGVALILFILTYVITRSFERLAEANRMKSEFVSIVSHQLRAPLSNLKWTIDLLLSEKIDLEKEKGVEYLKILEENTQRMGDLISDLLTVSRIEQGKFFARNKSVSLKEMIEEVINEMSIFCKANDVRVIFEPEEGPSQISIDPSQIKIVITNLLDNAIRYINDNGKIEMKLKKDGKNLYFEIKDNGVGIPEGDQNLIFQKFFRSRNALKKQTNGSGLGLYIAKSIIEKARGRIDFKSQEGSGSTFWFTLPIK